MCDERGDVFLSLRRPKLDQVRLVSSNASGKSLPSTPELRRKYCNHKRISIDKGGTRKELSESFDSMALRKIAQKMTTGGSSTLLNQLNTVEREELERGKSYDQWKNEKDAKLKHEQGKMVQSSKEWSDMNTIHLKKHEKFAERNFKKWLESKDDMKRRNKLKTLERDEWNRMNTLHNEKHEKITERCYNQWLIDKYNEELSKELRRFNDVKRKSDDKTECSLSPRPKNNDVTVSKTVACHKR